MELGSLFGRLLDRVDRTPSVERANSFSEFEALTTQRGSKHVSIHLRFKVDSKTGLYTPHSSYSSWRGDQADKVAYDESYLGTFNQQDARNRLYLTVNNRTEELRRKIRWPRFEFKFVLMQDDKLKDYYELRESDIEITAEQAKRLNYGPLVLDQRSQQAA